MVPPESEQKTPSIILFSELGVWNLYFLLKLYLFATHSINFHFLENIAFLLFIIAPFQTHFLYKLRQVVVIPMGISLLYYDSWLPSFDKLIIQIKNLASFDISYLFELSTRFFNFELVSAFFVVVVCYYYFKNWIKFTSITIGLFSYFLFMQYYQPEADTKTQIVRAQNTFNNTNTQSSNSPDEHLQQFFSYEAKRKIGYDNVTMNQPFELLFLNVCSLSWDDLKHTGLDTHILFDKFDIMFQQFNTATSYSGPAAIRLLRASCGQRTHSQLYSPADNQCYLFNNLAKLGFGQNLLMNHDGKFDNFEQYIRKEGGWNVPNQLDPQSPLIQKSFDGSPIYSDRSLFDQWLAKTDSKPSATLYNTVSLHDGNKILGNQSRLNSLENFHPRLLTLLNDINYLFEKIEQSGRKVMVVLVPEHGAGIKGDNLQLAGMREFPSYNITHVPVGVKLFGMPKGKEQTLNVSSPTSYLAISKLVQQVVEKDMFGEPTSTLSAIINSLPTTEPVSENDSATVIRHNGTYQMKIGEEDWIQYGNDN
ncbi:cellulose biosynthesis protein BcsG [Psychrosphaera aquimarina]|uniref:Cellulose biosynthesis protein BcsG n=1 Tax=Psychrosphaera aquimarina TaxID=2044854 RepID=A0ABU3QZH9_9GAMM|nr:cellulose biosynthesis protein BcsG [Psychrosphaera aquimarina]MDU0112851.1 cellulose biosynthesis protein BcsG [Psychrosphaera aquimarina]